MEKDRLKTTLIVSVLSYQDATNASNSTTETLLKRALGIPISVDTSGVKMLMVVSTATPILKNIKKTCVFVTRFIEKV